MDLSSLYPTRNPHVHKRQFGKLLVIAGSKKYTGSPIFNAVAALRAGCDLVTIVTPERSALVAASYAPDIITIPLKGDYLSKAHIDEILQTIQTDHITAVVIGGGLGRTDTVYDAIEELLLKVDLPLVIDAEAIRCIGTRNLSLNGKYRCILTPNRNEILSLISQETLPNEKQLQDETKDVARSLNSTILLKGHVDFITDGEHDAENKTGSPYMTKGGFGDTLAGVCGALLARGVEPLQAARAAAYVNGRAGELAAKAYGESLMASDIFATLPHVLRHG